MAGIVIHQQAIVKLPLLLHRNCDMANLCDGEMVAGWKLFIPNRGLLFGGDILQAQLNSSEFHLSESPGGCEEGGEDGEMNRIKKGQNTATPIILQLHPFHCLSIPTVLSLIRLPSSLELGWHQSARSCYVAQNINWTTLLMLMFHSLSHLFSPGARSQPAKARRPADESPGRRASWDAQQVASLVASILTKVGHHSSKEPLSDGTWQRRQACLHTYIW